MRTRGYDLFKSIVVLLLVILLLVLLLRFGGAMRTRWTALVTRVEASPTIGPVPTSPPVATSPPTATTAPMSTPVPSPTTAPTLTPGRTPTVMPSPTSAVVPPTLDLPGTGVQVGEWTLAGGGTPGSRVRVTIGGQEAGEAEVGPDGRWSLPVTVDEPGEHEVRLEAVEDGQIVALADPIPVQVAALEGSEESSAREATVSQRRDLTTPALPFPVVGALRAGPVMLEGTGEPDAGIELLDEGVVVGTTTIQPDGTWRLEVELDPGSHALSVQYAGQEGTESQAQPISVVPAEEICPYVPVPADESSCSADPPPGEDRGDTYVVARCETIRLIAVRAGVSVRDLLAVNPQVCNPNLIYVGQVLALPPRE